MSSGPPKFIQPQPRLIQGFIAPTFDPRFHTDDKNREHTFLGLAVELWARARTHPQELPGDDHDLLDRLEGFLTATCPEVIRELHCNL